MRLNIIKSVRRALGAALGAALISVALPASPASAVELSTWGTLVNNYSNLCLEVSGWSTANGAAVDQWDCHNGANQQWIGETRGNARLIRNAKSGKCLEVQGWSTANGATIDQWDCHGGANQLWQLRPTSDYTVALYNVNSGKCLEIGGWRIDNGAPATQWDCHWGENQRWY
ncbi:RICIN domain-containing protein [Streptomyces sp. NPDC093225]|uniref:RICIN domain-containing protein n=1 Tax=Streptomyces sp. NPDC093225 TaxID=3366034 RepID=UPI00380D6020